mgnify:FL=1
MTKRVFQSIFLCAAVTLILTAVFTTLFQYRTARENLQTQIEEEATYISEAFDTVESGARASLFDRIGKISQNRITWISENGEVLYDNRADADNMDNHLSRPEVSEAASDGTGESERDSATRKTETLYYALRLSDGSLLRIAAESASLWGILGDTYSPLLLIAAVVLLLAGFIAFVLTRAIVRPFNTLDLKHPLENKTYDELSPLLRRLDKQNQESHEQVRLLTARQEEFDLITSGMQEGLVIFSKDGTVLSANAAARAILSGETGGSYLQLCREKHYLSVVESALAGKAKTKKMKQGGRVYTLTATPVQNSLAGNAAVLFIVDITDSELSEKMRREFSANVSHELKTPLTSILGYTEIIGNGLANESDIPKFADRIHKEAARLLTLIEDIIKLSQLDEDELRAEFVPVKLSELCQSVLQELSQKAEKAGVTLHFSGDEQTVSGFEPSLYEMIYNLCDNAIAYNKPGGSVNVSLEKTPEDKIRLTVRDTGIGIAEEHLGRVFERFYRVDKSHSKETGGTGLGLSIVKHAALMHDAELSIESTPQVGTTVQILFKPLKTN